MQVAAVALCAFLGMASACKRSTPEQALRRELSALQAAIETRDAGGVRDLLAEDFVGNDGLDRDGARRLAALYFMRNDKVGVTVGPLDVAMHGHHATVRCTVALTGGGAGLLPDSGRIRRVESGWRLEDGGWRMTSIAWDPQ
jgi:ketosteroid isomerase-like protein